MYEINYNSVLGELYHLSKMTNSIEAAELIDLLEEGCTSIRIPYNSTEFEFSAIIRDVDEVIKSIDNDSHTLHKVIKPAYYHYPSYHYRFKSKKTNLYNAKGIPFLVPGAICNLSVDGKYYKLVTILYIEAMMKELNVSNVLELPLNKVFKSNIELPNELTVKDLIFVRTGKDITYLLGDSNLTLLKPDALANIEIFSKVNKLVPGIQSKLFLYELKEIMSYQHSRDDDMDELDYCNKNIIASVVWLDEFNNVCPNPDFIIVSRKIAPYTDDKRNAVKQSLLNYDFNGRQNKSVYSINTVPNGIVITFYIDYRIYEWYQSKIKLQLDSLEADRIQEYE